jgi:NTP pyrophosphatase (non-canonical NTP hydrolase)
MPPNIGEVIMNDQDDSHFGGYQKASKPTVICTSLRDANRVRDKEWGGGRLSASFFSNELGGEVGEALDVATKLLAIAISCGRAQNLVKKLERENLGIRGSRTTTSDLAEELADVIICTDLVANIYGIDLDKAVDDKFNKTSIANNLETRLKRR